jgi:hypothetical protein
MEVFMRISALSIIALLGLCVATPCASAQDVTAVSTHGVITASDYVKIQAANDTCEARRIERNIARVDTVEYPRFMLSCTNEELKGSAVHALPPPWQHLGITPNTYKRETLAQASRICRLYVQKHTSFDGLPPAYAMYGAAAAISSCLESEIPR